MSQGILQCLACGDSSLLVEKAEARCGSCAATYPVLRGAIDFRDAARDLSAGYDFTLDNLYAAKLSEAFSATSTVSELRGLLDAMRKRRALGESIEAIDSVALLREEGIRPVPYSEADAAHGRSILEKIPLYADGAGLPDLSTGVALEDGAGAGYFISGLAERFQHVFALDLSMSYMMFAAKIVEELGLANVTLICASAEHLPLANASIDFIHSNNVIEHVGNQGRMIAEANRVIDPDGLLFIMSPNRFSLYFEPHFRLPGYGFFPPAVRKWVVRRWQGYNTDDVDLRSLNELRRLVRSNFDGRAVYSFIPRRLATTVSGGFLRKSLTGLLKAPVLGGAASFVVNRLGLGVMPYHVVLASKSSG